MVAAAVVAAPVQASEPAWVAQMPSSQDVFAKIKGRDFFDTRIRRYAAFERLVAITSELEGPREFDPTPGEARVGLEYRQNVGRMNTDAQSLPGAKRTAFYKRAYAYESDARFNRQLLAALFTPAVRLAYTKAHGVVVRDDSRRKAEQKAAAKRDLQNQKALDDAQADDPGVPLRLKIIFGVLIVLVGLGGGGGTWVYVRW